MKLFTLIRRELFYRPRRTLAALLAVAIAAAALTAAFTLLRLHDRAARNLLAEREKQTAETGAVLRDEMRKATLKLGFNLLILPEQVDLKQWHIDQESRFTLPESYGEKLVKSGIVSVRHILPMLQKRIVWPETGRTIVLIGTRGEATALFKNPRASLIQPVPEGSIVLGYELHHSLGISSNRTVTLMGREFKIYRLHKERGSKDDITAWIHLKDAQELLGMQGKISSLLALECLCIGANMLDRVRSEVVSILPGTQVVEMGAKVIARAEARIRAGEETARQLDAETEKQRQLQLQRQRFAALLSPLMLLLCGGWISLLTFSDVRDRRIEIGMLRTIGFRTHSILFLFLGKSLMVGTAGGAIGYVAAALLCDARTTGMAGFPADDAASVWSLSSLLISMVGAVVLMMVAGWIPALIAAQTDPANVLREE